MREILFIVMENAVRYNHNGGSIKIAPRAQDGSFELSIENTGIGITQEEAGKIGSSLFYRGESARQNHPIGMGIGLSVVKAVIKAHHGTFSIESKGKNEGARLMIKLPL
jgi:two-component system phosphate regulon sensor histidine kinase PhoR